MNIIKHLLDTHPLIHEDTRQIHMVSLPQDHHTEMIVVISSKTMVVVVPVVPAVDK
jgi:hypothetical protein